MEGTHSLDTIQIRSEEAAYIALEINAIERNIFIRWLRPVNCDECERGVKVAARVAEAFKELRGKPYSIAQD